MKEPDNKLRLIQLLIEERDGFALIEVLVSLTLVALLSAAITASSIAALRVAKLTELNHAASSLALSKIEELAAIDVSDLDDTFDENDDSLAWADSNMTFTRAVTVTVNGDGSRTVAVQVFSNSEEFPTDVHFTTSFALWE